MSANTPDRDAIVHALHSVIEPRSQRDVVALGLVREVGVADDAIRVVYQLPPEFAQPQTRDLLAAQTRKQLGELAKTVEVEFAEQAARPTNTIPGVSHVVAVGAGKGGVGKSTVSTLLAYGLKRRKLRAGLLDADVYGPSMPKLTGTEQTQPQVDEQGRIIPPIARDVPILSMGHLVPDDQAVIWRGPMAQKYVKEFLDRGLWGELDFLIVDLPPGTGDIPLTLAQSIPLTGAVVVCTPQDLALIDAVKAQRMYEKLGVETLGFIENMSVYVCPQCGHRAALFGDGGVRRAAEDLSVPFLGGIPLNIEVRELADAGRVAEAFDASPQPVREALDELIDRFLEQVELRDRQSTPLPQLRIHG